MRVDLAFWTPLIPHLEPAFGKALPEFVGDLHRGMRGIVGYIGKEWPPGIHCPLDEGNRLVREVIDAKTLAPDRTSVPLKERAVIVAPVTTAETIERIKTTCFR